MPAVFFPAFLITVSVVFFLMWETAAGADNAVPAEETSQDLLTGEYPHEGGDALNELMRSITRSRTFDQTLYGLEGNYEVVEEVSGKLEEDGEIVRIRLIALRREDG
ncbi:MAG: hypothetical protein FWG71_10765, partial [Synergistaceae bacterium]|nr:hypothetical protein [Synergistaceae bacterium]